MFRIGLTGSIASGKSTVLGLFSQRGVPTISADAIVHDLYADEAVGPVSELFPAAIRAGGIDRDALAGVVLTDPARMKQLESVVHPMVRERIRQFLDEAEAAGEPLAVVDVPLLFESGYDYGFDAVAVTVCDVDTLRRRALVRPGMTVDKLEAILARQMPQAEKRAKAAYVFDTDLPLSQTTEMVDALVDAIRARPDGI